MLSHVTHDGHDHQSHEELADAPLFGDRLHRAHEDIALEGNEHGAHAKPEDACCQDHSGPSSDSTNTSTASACSERNVSS